MGAAEFKDAAPTPIGKDGKQPELVRLGAAVRDLRKLRGLSQQELADRLKINRVTLSRFENGKHDLGMSHLRTLVLVLGSPGVDPVSALLNFQLPPAD